MQQPNQDKDGPTLTAKTNEAWHKFEQWLETGEYPITDTDLRTVFRLIIGRVRALESKADDRHNWNIDVPKFPIRIIGGKRFNQQNLFDPAPDPIDASRKLHTCYEGCLCQSGKMPIEDFANYERDYRLPSLSDEDDQC